MVANEYRLHFLNFQTLSGLLLRVLISSDFGVEGLQIHTRVIRQHYMPCIARGYPYLSPIMYYEASIIIRSQPIRNLVFQKQPCMQLPNDHTILTNRLSRPPLFVFNLGIRFVVNAEHIQAIITLSLAGEIGEDVGNSSVEKLLVDLDTESFRVRLTTYIPERD